MANSARKDEFFSHTGRRDFNPKPWIESPSPALSEVKVKAVRGVSANQQYGCSAKRKSPGTIAQSPQ
ncbi:hypothetical protein [Thermocoleostomius sinensis]|uniref:Uncharacterized protein n=1 Tax=Thermocoleostomius sinensis A174 TaxID=2016057 RepID=A0A9E9C9H6_9CYAN|nr:hypothetical protein [Thermocoleostomius sinensis]WAL62719.1 hypothetical protein OXH18_12215 [Thermocoleostomius sinensis A174]